jgi:hypothetical protein
MDQSQEPKARDRTGEVAGSGPGEGAPRWVKAAGIVALVVVLLAVVMLAVKGHHGPSRHFGGQAPLSGVAAPAVQAAGGTG